MENQSPTAREAFQDIVQIVETTSTADVNRYLALGWVMLGLSSSQYMESTSMHYHLAGAASLVHRKCCRLIPTRSSGSLHLDAILNKYFPIDGQPLDYAVAITHRLQLVKQYNALFGVPGPINAAGSQSIPHRHRICEGCGGTAISDAWH